jgi:hypothetical protein
VHARLSRQQLSESAARPLRVTRKRLRQPGTFLRWRPGRYPEDCHLDQLRWTAVSLAAACSHADDVGRQRLRLLEVRPVRLAQEFELKLQPV